MVIGRDFREKNYFQYTRVVNKAFDTSTEIFEYLADNIDLYRCNRLPKMAVALLVPAVNPIAILCGAHSPDGSLDCIDIGCEEENGHCVRTIHAEQRTIAVAARLGVSTQGATIYSILKPCYQCSKILITAGVDKIYYLHAAYDEQRTKDILARAGVYCVQVANSTKLEIDNA